MKSIPWSQMMTNQSAIQWKRWSISIAAIIVVIALSLIVINQTALPTIVGQRLVVAIEENTGWDVQLRGIRLTSVGSVRLQGVTLEQASSETSVTLPQVDVAIHPLRLLIGSSDASVIRRVHVTQPRITVPFAPWATGMETSSIRLTEAERPTSVEHSESKATPTPLYVTVAQGVIQEVDAQGIPQRVWSADGALWFDARDQVVLSVDELIINEVGGQSTLMVSGTPSGSTTQWTWNAQVTRDLLGSIWPATGLFGQDIVDVTMHATADDKAWHIDQLDLALGDATIHGHGRVDFSVGSLGQARLDVALDASGLDFPDDIPRLDEYGMRGMAQFQGVLTGTLGAPELVGDLSLRDGAVWHRAVTRAEGEIALSRDGFSFDRTVLENGQARYELVGQVGLESAAGQLSIELTARRGRVEELLAAFGLDPHVTGELDGVIDLSGAVGALTVTGSVSGSNLIVMNEAPIDAATGGFSWSNGLLKIGSLNATSKQGELTATGDVSDQVLNLSVSLSEWPVEPGLVRLLSLPQEVAGTISYSGNVGGSLDAPYVTGHLRGGALSLGRLSLADPKGWIVASTDRLQVSDMEVKSVGDGTYRLSGHVDNWLSDRPAIDVGIDVQGASLSAILAENGLEWPARLIDGDVRGRITMQGDPKRPDADFALALSDPAAPQGAFTLRFRLDQGRLQLGNLPLVIGEDGLKLGGDVSGLAGRINLMDLPGLQGLFGSADPHPGETG